MRLSPGTRVGAYEVVALIGAGGMGEVYRAVDTGLGRDVAIKVLPLEFTADPERVGRFEREARTLALLNHPNIATVHGYEHATASTAAGPISIPALVMEFVDGRRWQIALRKDASRPARMFFTRVHTRVLHVRSHDGSPRAFTRAFSTGFARGSSRTRFVTGFPHASQPCSRFSTFTSGLRTFIRTRVKNCRVNRRGEPPCERPWRTTVRTPVENHRANLRGEPPSHSGL
jgi:hypothetical protein